jgi:predicted RNA-binding protein
LGDRRDLIHKVTVSGMYGPVPEEYEREDAVLEYEYMLANEDTEQIELVTDRLVRFLEAYGDEYDHIVGYVASKNYRQAISDAIDTYGRGEVFPRDPRALQLTEHFRNTNIEELLSYFDSHPPKTQSEP